MAACKKSDHCTQYRFSERVNVKSDCNIIPESANILADQYYTTPYNSLDDQFTTFKKKNITGKYIPLGLHSNQIFRLLKSGINLLCKKSLLINLTDLSKIIDDKPATSKNITTLKPFRCNPIPDSFRV